MSRPVGDVTARGVTEIGEATASTVSGYTFTTVVALTPDTSLAEWQDRGTRVFAVRQDGRLYAKPLTATPSSPTTGDLWLENVAGVTHLRFQGLQGLVTADTGTAGLTSVALTAPTQFSVSGSPLTSNGTLGFSWVNQSQNLVLAGPTSGTGAPTFRALVAGDIPSLPYLPASGGTTGYLATWSSASAITATQYLPAGNFPALSGDITSSAGSLATTLTSVITAGGPTGSTSTTPVITWDAKGRLTAVTSATITASAIGALPASGGTTGYLATWSSASAITATQYLPGGNFPALTGDVTSTAGALGTTIANSAVTLAKMANLAANSIIGNNTGSAATPLALTTTQVKTLLAIASTDVSGLGVFATSTSASNLTGTVPAATLPLFTSVANGAVAASGGGTTNFLRADGTWAAPVGTFSGSIASGQVAVGSGSNAISGSSSLTFSGGALVVGTDPTGAQILRVGGAGIFQGALTVRNGSTQDSLVLQGAAIGSSSRSITLTTPATAIGASYTQTFQARSGVIAVQGEGLFTNLLHNGDVQVDQRNTLGTPITGSANTYGPDGWSGSKNNGTNVFTIGKVAVSNTPATGALYACKLNVTTGATQGAGEALQLIRSVEGTFFRRTSFGTAQAAALYVSFWAESTLTGTFSLSLRNATAARSYVVNCTIASANTRQLFQFTIPGDTTGTWATDTTAGVFVVFCPACGSTLQTTANAWQAGNFLGTSSTTLLNNTTGSLQISDLYVGTTPIGTTSLDFPRLPYDVELLRCMRYYETGLTRLRGQDVGSSTVVQVFPMKVNKRVAPAVTGTGVGTSVLTTSELSIQIAGAGLVDTGNVTWTASAEL